MNGQAHCECPSPDCDEKNKTKVGEKVCNPVLKQKKKVIVLVWGGLIRGMSISVIVGRGGAGVWL